MMPVAVSFSFSMENKVSIYIYTLEIRLFGENGEAKTPVLGVNPSSLNWACLISSPLGTLMGCSCRYYMPYSKWLHSCLHLRRQRTVFVKKKNEKKNKKKSSWQEKTIIVIKKQVFWGYLAELLSFSFNLPAAVHETRVIRCQNVLLVICLR
jgi:hypothetical protein